MTDAIADVLDDFDEVYAALDDRLPVTVRPGKRAIVAALLVVAFNVDWLARMTRQVADVDVAVAEEEIA